MNSSFRIASFPNAVFIWGVVLSVALTLAPDRVTAQTQYSAGFTYIEPTPERPLKVGIWYPSSSEETLQRWGPFEVSLAWKGAAAEGRFPVVLLSHGWTGRYRNHRDTASALARAGFIVVAPQHRFDQWIGTGNTQLAINLRVAELAAAMFALRSRPRLRRIAQNDVVGTLGYSLGGLTSLAAGGARPDLTRIETHCAQLGDGDSQFCSYNRWWWRAFARLRQWWSNEAPPAADFSDLPLPALQSIALVAPVGVPFSRESLLSITAKVGVFRLGDDAEVRYPYHADHIVQSLGTRVLDYRVHTGVHHYAFISPFPEWLKAEEHIPVAIDPEGFDRSEFLAKINAEIVKYFQKTLLSG
ncbi:MAG: dienelactone hydrolase family protein [Pseudomonadota bacterium]